MRWEETLRKTLTQAHNPSENLEKHSPPASVLIVIGQNSKSNVDQILLTKRTHSVETHKGQVSFPGGFFEAHDADLLHTALREFEEELGAKHRDVEILGALTPLKTRGEIIIFPWVGRMQFPYSFRPNKSEVERLLYLPLERLMTDGMQSVEVHTEGATVKSVGFYLDGELVWGATARILEELRECLDSSAEKVKMPKIPCR